MFFSPGIAFVCAHFLRSFLPSSDKILFTKMHDLVNNIYQHVVTCPLSIIMI